MSGFILLVGGWLKLHNHDSSHCILSSLKLEHLIFQARSFMILHSTSSDVTVVAYIDVSFCKLQRYIYIHIRTYTVSIQVHLKWSNFRRSWFMPYFHHICVPGSTRSSSCCRWASFCFRCFTCQDNVVIRQNTQFSSYLIERQWLITFSTHISHVIEMDVQMWLNQYPWSSADITVWVKT